jgi:hypothetical protein
MTKKLFILILSCAATIALKAQSAAIPGVELYGKVSQADLELKQCDFEKDANAEVLFNVGKLYYGNDLYSLIKIVHKRIKIFNDNGKNAADVHIKYYSINRAENISGIEAETINLANGKTEITKLDKKLIYNTHINKAQSEISFTLPNVKPGCIIEYKYTWTANYNASIPAWYFQESIPVRYCEFRTAIPDIFYFRPQPHYNQPLMKDSIAKLGRVLQVFTHSTNIKTFSARTETHDDADSFPYTLVTETRVMANIPSLQDEPYMSSFADNVQSLRLQLVNVKPIGGFDKPISDTWAKVGEIIADDDDFGGQLKRKLTAEEFIVDSAKSLKTTDAKIAYIFNEVKNSMKWNGRDDWETDDGTYRAWETKTGNSAEINLILYHLLKQSGINAYPMVVSTVENGKFDQYYTSLSQFNRAVVYVPVDSTRNFVLDATDKFNTYNDPPYELLNSSGLFIDKSKRLYSIVDIEKKSPVRHTVLINAEIKPGGKLHGNAQITCVSYDRINVIKRYKTDGEKKYTDYIRDNDNSLKVSSIKFENMDVDTLPLIQKIDFDLDMAGSDENYIYLNPNIFTSIKTNPFLSENRMTDIEFGYLRNYSINGVFKIPSGYKTDALPQSAVVAMPDKSIVFRRIVIEQEGSIIIRYSINYNKSEYPKDYYLDLKVFFKKMYDMLNEQIVLKKT